VEPSINVNKRMGNVYDPDTYHSFTKDVFTYITYADINADLSNNHFREIKEQEMQIGDTLMLSKTSFLLENIRIDSNNGDLNIDNVAIIAQLHQITDNDNPIVFDIAYRIKSGHIEKEEKIVESEKLRFRIVNISAQTKGIIIGVDKMDMEFLVIKSTVFPYISIMWIGVLITFIGLFISLYRNTKFSIMLKL
jgi:cytochrome c-type biogenesis protein CcmF